FTLFSVTIRLIVRSQFSGVARRYEIRDSRWLASLAWHEPHFARTRSLRTGIPCSGAASALPDTGPAGVCAPGCDASGKNTKATTNRTTRLGMAQSLHLWSENSARDQERERAEHIGQRRVPFVCPAVCIEDICD